MSVVSQWDDFRGGTGFGPSFTAAGSARPTWDAANKRLVGDGVNMNMATAASALFDLAGPKTLYMVISFPTVVGPKYMAAIGDSASPTRLIALGNGADDSDPIGYFGSGFIPCDASVPLSPALRLFIFTKNGTTGVSGLVPNGPKITNVLGGAMPGGNNPLALFTYFAGSGLYHNGQIRAVGVLNREATLADVAALKTWAQTYHGVTLPTRFVVFEGDSITMGHGITNRQSYPAGTLAKAFYQTAYTYADIATSGASIQVDIPGRAATTDALYDATRAKNILVIMAGINDIAAGRTTTQVTTDLWSYTDARRVTGYKVLVGTVIPAGRQAGWAPADQAALNTAIAAVNAAITANWALHADGMIDFTSLAPFNDPASFSNLTYYQADQLHPTAAGAAILANAADPVLQTA